VEVEGVVTTPLIRGTNNHQRHPTEH
jgi:hypothetical protein